MQPDVLYVPFHDARKWLHEGVRTRDGHVCRALVASTDPIRLTVADRPTSIAEYVRRRGRWYSTVDATRVSSRLRLSRAPTGAMTIDVLLASLGFRQGSFHLWQMAAYGCSSYLKALRSGLARLERDVSHIWLCHPFAARIRDLLPDTPVLVDAFDNFAVHPELSPRVRAAARLAYLELCATAEHIVVNSDAMREYLWDLARRDVPVVPNGVDASLFQNAEPIGVPASEGPIVGYAGKLGRRIDVELLVRTADALPSGRVVVAGQVLSRSWMANALSHPRIAHIGDLHYSKIPSFLATCDICIVPHRVGLGENHGDATKIYEYMAAGKTIVTTAIGGVERFAGRITIARTTEQFVDAVVAASRGAVLPRGALLESETWRSRTRAIREAFQLSGVVEPKVDNDAPDLRGTRPWSQSGLVGER